MFSNHEQKTTENGLKTGTIRLKTVKPAEREQETTSMSLTLSFFNTKYILKHGQQMQRKLPNITGKFKSQLQLTLTPIPPVKMSVVNKNSS